MAVFSVPDVVRLAASSPVPLYIGGNGTVARRGRKTTGLPVPSSIGTIGTLDVRPGGYACYANATGNGEGTRFSAVTNLGTVFEVEVAFGATSSGLFAVAVPVPLYVSGNGTVARRGRKTTRTKRPA